MVVTGGRRRCNTRCGLRRTLLNIYVYQIYAFVSCPQKLYQCRAVDGVESFFLGQNHLLKVVMLLQLFFHRIDGVTERLVLENWSPYLQPGIQLVHITLQNLLSTRH